MPLTPAHQDVYEKFLIRLLAKAAKEDFTRQALGRYLIEMLHAQYLALESAKTGTGEPFDTLNAAKDFVYSLTHNTSWMSEKGDKVCAELNDNLKLLEDALEKKHRHLWMADGGKYRLQRALDQSRSTGMAAAMFPLRTRALRGTLIAVYGALAVEPDLKTWKIALETALNAYDTYRFDFCHLTKASGPGFLALNRLVTEMVDQIDERIAAKEAADQAAKAAAELAAAQAAAADAERREATRYADAPRYTPQAISRVDPEPDYWTNWEPEYNCANGLPMMGGVDVLGNVYGTDSNDW